MVYSSPYGYQDIPQVDLWSLFFRRKDRVFPDQKTIFQSGDHESRKYTFGELKTKSLEFGKVLKARYSVRKGDMVNIFSANDIDYPPVVYGALWAGACVAPANPGYTLGEYVHQLRDSNPKVVITQLPNLPLVLEACAVVGISHSNVLLMGAEKDRSMTFKHWSTLRAMSSRFLIQPDISPKQDLAFLVYSSGTTGNPKGVELTHYNLTSNIFQAGATEFDALNWTGSDRKVPGIPNAPENGDTMLTFLPFFHIYGLLFMVLSPVWTGIKIIVMSQFRLEQWCALAERYRVTVAYLVPPILILLAKHPIVDNYDLSSFRMTISGAAPCSRELVEGVYKRIGMRVKQGYGLSETSPVAFTQKWGDWRTSVGSTGNLLPNMQAKFCHLPGSEDYSEFEAREVPTGAVGELYLKGPNVFRGYHNNEAATRECLTTDGWFRTGDVGYLDARGDLYITDRVKELIKYKGFQVAPAELEGHLVDHELVNDAGVIGVDSQILGTEVPRAYVVRKGGVSAVREGDDAAIIAWVSERVANHKKLRGGIRFVDSIPKNPSGKILRRVMKAEARKEFKLLEEALMVAEVPMAHANL